VDISYVNLAGTFYYLYSVLDGYSRYLVHWELRESMKEAEVKTVLQRAREKFPQARPRIISDNGPQFYPQSNGKIERWHQSLKGECLPPGVPSSIEEAQRLLALRRPLRFVLTGGLVLHCWRATLPRDNPVGSSRR
jgi:transposase InsO family protein